MSRRGKEWKIIKKWLKIHLEVQKLKKFLPRGRKLSRSGKEFWKIKSSLKMHLEVQKWKKSCPGEVETLSPGPLPCALWPLKKLKLSRSVKEWKKS